MADEKEKAAPAPKGGGGGLLGMLLPAVIAGAAAFGGAKVAGAHRAIEAAAPEQKEAKPPGPTLALEPFLLTVPDASKKAHPMKVTLAVEFEGAAGGKEEGDGFKVLVPRIRDTTLNYLRTTSFEDALDPTASDKMRTELLERIKAAGVPNAQRVLITDLVTQ